MPLFKSPTWKTDYPEGWASEQSEDGTTAFYDSENDVGTVEISCICTDSPVTDDDLREFADDLIGAGKSFSKVDMGDLSGLMFRYHADDEAWMEWYLAYDNCLFFITYGCAVKYEGIEDEEVASIIEHLSLVESD